MGSSTLIAPVGAVAGGGDVGQGKKQGMFHRRLLILLLCSLGVAAVDVRDAAAGPRWRRHRCVCRCQAQPAVEVPREVEQTLRQLRPHFPGKTDNQIIQILRGYLTHDDSTTKNAVRWLAERLDRAKKQKEAAAAIRKLGGEVIHDREFDRTATQYGDLLAAIAALDRPAPTWLRSLLGNDFFTHVDDVTLKATHGGMQSISGQETPRYHSRQSGEAPHSVH